MNVEPVPNFRITALAILSQGLLEEAGMNGVGRIKTTCFNVSPKNGVAQQWQRWNTDQTLELTKDTPQLEVGDKYIKYFGENDPVMMRLYDV